MIHDAVFGIVDVFPRGQRYTRDVVGRLVLLALVMACGDNRAGQPPADASRLGVCDVACAGACRAYAEARCTRLAACSPTRLRIAWPDLDSCIARYELGCRAELVAPGAGATAMTKTACAGAIAAQTCPEFLVGAGPPAVCAVPRGAIAPGGACSYDSQCDSGRCKSMMIGCGTCEPPRARDCWTSGCEPTQYCDHETGECRALRAEGEACVRYETERYLCDYGLSCSKPYLSHHGTCKPVETSVGAACEISGYQPVACDLDRGLDCVPDGSSATCQPIELREPGEACGYVDPCAAGASCRTVCVAPVADGSACEAAPCLAPAQCIGGTCRIPTGDGC